MKILTSTGKLLTGVIRDVELLQADLSGGTGAPRS
jgi:hypothetical protein